MPESKIYDCQNYQTQLSAYFDNEFPSWKRHIIKWHLKRCPNCSDRYATLKRMDSLLHFVEPVKASDTFLSSVMSRVTTMQTTQKVHKSSFNRLGSFIKNMKVWMRGNIRAYNPFYMVGFIFGVFMMIGVTLYSPRIEKLNPFTQYSSKSSKVQQEKFISFEVIEQQEPKRPLKIR